MQKRSRAKHPPIILTDYRLANWQANTALLKWARETPEFRQLLTVLINERERATHQATNITTENCRLGMLQGYDEAVKVLKELVLAPDVPRGTIYPTYPTPPPETMIFEQPNAYDTE